MLGTGNIPANLSMPAQKGSTKMEETKYLPVEIDSSKKSGTQGIVYIKSSKIGPGFGISVSEKTLQNADDLITTGAEKYRAELLRVVGTFPKDALVEAFGEITPPVHTSENWCKHLVEKCTPGEFLTKLENYENAPKQGEVWQSNRDGFEAVILGNDGREVMFIYNNRQLGPRAEYFSADKFRRVFHKTDKPSCESLKPFLETIKGMKS